MGLDISAEEVEQELTGYPDNDTDLAIMTEKLNNTTKAQFNKPRKNIHVDKYYHLLTLNMFLWQYVDRKGKES